MYEKFREIDGRHPWRDVSPDGYVDYQARYRPHGRVLFFNFPLAKEMGLIPADHPASIGKELEQTILDTFSLRIINEYDLEQGTPASLGCQGGVIVDPPPPTLGYGQTRSVGTITCDVEPSGVTCTDSSTGHFLRLSRDSYQLG